MFTPMTLALTEHHTERVAFSLKQDLEEKSVRILGAKTIALLPMVALPLRTCSTGYGSAKVSVFHTPQRELSAAR